MDVVATVGMGPWPFDRLIRSVDALRYDHHVFIQTGASTVRPACDHAAFLTPSDLHRRLAAADVVVCHAGNTVRLVQQLGKVPVAMAREARRREMGNDHQVEFLRHEQRAGRVVAVWDGAELPVVVRRHPQVEQRILVERPAPVVSAPEAITQILDAAWRTTGGDPFARHPLRRYSFAWRALANRAGRHLDLGCGEGELLLALADGTDLECEGADPHADRVHALRSRHPELTVTQIEPDRRLPYGSETFTSVSMLDVLEHSAEHEALLAEARRVLVPGGLLVVTVPARHAFSWLDPDNLKLRTPRAHRLLYTLRFGAEQYAERFADRGDGLFGDMSRRASTHHNFEPGELETLLASAGLRVITRAGTNRFWRALQVAALVGGGALGRAFERLIYLDGLAGGSANLFVVAERAP